jgi:starvation-inducible DNA-binding protein
MPTTLTMNRTHNTAAPETRERVIALLAPELAAAADLKLAAKHVHWNLRGPNFHSLHELFDQVAAAMDEYADLIAERIVQLGGYAAGTLQQTAAATYLQPYAPEPLSERGHLEQYAKSLAGFGGRIRAAIRSAAETGDDTTADLLTEASRGIDKLVWMIEAHLA